MLKKKIYGQILKGETVEPMIKVYRKVRDMQMIGGRETGRKGIKGIEKKRRKRLRETDRQTNR